MPKAGVLAVRGQAPAQEFIKQPRQSVLILGLDTNLAETFMTIIPDTTANTGFRWEKYDSNAINYTAHTPLLPLYIDGKEKAVVAVL